MTNSTPNPATATHTAADERPAMAILREMEVGDSYTWPSERAAYIASLSSRCNFDWAPRRYSMRRNKDPRSITITRIA